MQHSVESFLQTVTFLSKVVRKNRRFWECFGTLTKISQGVEVQPATRRLILSTATTFFDPLGLISPVILPFKIMFQKLCKAQRDWDELVDTELNQEWLSTLSDLRLAGRVSFKRCYAEGLGGNEVKSLQLHCFADASEKAYRAVVYMRVEYEPRVECEIVTSKTRVTLLNKKTIPRLELLSNLTTSRLVKSVSQPLENVVKVNVVNWTDSMISLWWIRNTEEEYLTELRVHHNCNSNNRKLAIKVGDVICVYKNKAPRQLCGMGVVRSLITGRDGYHRGAVVRVRS